MKRLTANQISPSVETHSAYTAKLSISLPVSLMQFVDEQCQAFRVGRSAYFQMMLEAEELMPRRVFTKTARGANSTNSVRTDEVMEPVTE